MAAVVMIQPVAAMDVTARSVFQFRRSSLGSSAKAALGISAALSATIIIHFDTLAITASYILIAHSFGNHNRCYGMLTSERALT